MPKHFGSTIRAYRLGFREMIGVGFVRIKAHGPPWHVDVCPLDAVEIRCAGGEHVCWWEGDKAMVADAVTRALQNLQALEHMLLVLDDEGKLLGKKAFPIPVTSQGWCDFFAFDRVERPDA